VRQIHGHGNLAHCRHIAGSWQKSNHYHCFTGVRRHGRAKPAAATMTPEEEGELRVQLARLQLEDRAGFAELIRTVGPS
jgi:hypothetical protein